jgi:NAD-dependent SIR2 family protein deacetylase
VTLHALADLVGDGDVVVLSGAGLSTESGIPDYRGPSAAGRRAQPMTYQTFVGSVDARRRYWARSHLGWRHITGARPNDGHLAVAELQRRGLVAGVITQNVDGLHTAAGSPDVLELHGNLARVVCLDCGVRTTRAALDARLRAVNRTWDAHVRAVNPDGDVQVDDDTVATGRIVDCDTCGGVLKPDVVFFGENVPRPRVDAAYGLVETAGSIVVLGSSLTVMSGLRFVRHAATIGVPVAIVNQGATRGDELATLRINAPLGSALSELVKLAGEPLASAG